MRAYSNIIKERKKSEKSNTLIVKFLKLKKNGKDSLFYFIAVICHDANINLNFLILSLTPMMCDALCFVFFEMQSIFSFKTSWLF